MDIYEREKMLEKAKDSETGEYILSCILKQYIDDEEFLIALSTNQNINYDTAKQLFSISNKMLKNNKNSGYIIQKNLTNNSSVSNSILKFIVLNTKEKKVLRFILKHPNADEETKQIIYQILDKPLDDSKRKALVYMDSYRKELFKYFLYHLELFLEDISIFIEYGIDTENMVIMDTKEYLISQYPYCKIIEKKTIEEFLEQLNLIKKDGNLKRYHQLELNLESYKDLRTKLSSYDEFTQIDNIVKIDRNIVEAKFLLN